MNDQDEELWDTFGTPRHTKGYKKIQETKGPREKVCSRDDMWSTVFDFFLCANFALGLTTIRWLSKRKSYNTRDQIIPQNNVSIRTVGGHSHLFLCVTRYSTDWPMKRDYIHRKLYRFSVSKLSFVVRYSLSLFFLFFF